MKLAVGSRVVVSFGKKKILTGIVAEKHERRPENYRPKEVMEILDDQPIVNESQLRFFRWMARYYMCSLGEVINAALPAALKLSSESFISLNPMINPDDVNVSDREWNLLRTLKSDDLSV